MTSSAQALVAEADAAAAAGDFELARTRLRQAAEADASNGSPWLRLAAIERAAGNLPASLDATTRALTIAPLDFTALLMRASLLDRLQDPSAPEAWGHALAQRPEGELPPPMTQALARGERVHANWLEKRKRVMEQASASAEERADEDERKRIGRFRSNVLHVTRPYHSTPTHFHYPGLVEREFHPRRHFPWLAELESATDEITAELAAVMAAERAELVPYIQYAEHEPLDQWRPLNKNRDWTAIHLLQNGRRIEANAAHCPQTLKLLARFPQPDIPGAGPNAMFSLLAPQTQIPAHVGVNNARLVCHLPLRVPEGCWFRVGAETRFWSPGEAFVFDDTIEHEAMNPTDNLRVVLIFDVWHPDLSEVERDAVAAIVGIGDRPPAAL